MNYCQCHFIWLNFLLRGERNSMESHVPCDCGSIWGIYKDVLYKIVMRWAFVLRCFDGDVKDSRLVCGLKEHIL